ncbi:MAG: choice-of-anchor I family protein [Bacteroidota bacterium]
MTKKLSSIFLSVCALLLVHSTAHGQISAKFVGRYSIGNYTAAGGAAEITAFDPTSKRMFVINGPDSSLRIVNVSNPALPVQISKISIKPYGIDLTSVACKNGLVAVAVIDSNGKTNPSNIVFMDINGNFISKVKAGANADNVVFTPDGTKLLVANEGEPNLDYTIDPEGSISIINLAGGAASLTQANVQTAGFIAYNTPTVLDSRIRIFGRIQSGGTFLRNSTVAEDMEPEYISISDDGTTAWVTCQENNCVAVVNINTATVTSLLPLGFKNYNLAGNGLDPSDRDGAGNTALANIVNLPVFGLFLPDGISSYRVNSQNYFITANEGDARADWGAANLEENRVGDAAYVLDTVKFGGAATVAAIKANAALGRLTVTNRYGDFNNDGKFDSIFTFGGRGFSIWNATTGALVWDSKDEFERKTLAMFPANFNTGHTTNALDDRSDNKGPEPESVTVGKIKDSTYAFVALERIGGIMIYNITIPTAPYFVQYINTRDFSVTPNQTNLVTVGDLGPEGIVFIPASESPTGENMIMLSNEVSSTVAFYTVNTPETDGITKLQDYTNRTSAAIGTFQGINYKEAGFSTLFPIPNTNGTEFWTCSDRGVNIDCANANLAGCRPTYDKMYAFPSYVPKIHRIRIAGDSIHILQTITIKRPNGTGSSGIINPTGLGSTATEVASTDTVLNCANFSLKTTPKDTFGIDPEGLVVDKNGNFWLCEEGGATIWKLNPNGVLIKRYTPYANLAGVQAVDAAIDTVFKYRKNNRGFEGISIAPNGKIYSMIQSPLLYPTQTIGDNTRVHRIIEIDPATGNQRMLVYLNDGVIGAAGANQIRLSDWKIGDMAAVNDSTFLVLEAALRGTTDIKRLYQININQATAVHSGLYGGLTVEGLVDSTGLANNGIKAVTKKLVIDLLASGWPAVLDKAEGLAIINDSTVAIGNDNDFGQKSAAANGIATATGNLSHVMTYRLAGARKLINYTPAASLVSSQSAYLTPVASGVKLDALLTVGDPINGYKMAGLGDGLGAYDNGNGTFTLLMNHEMGNTVGVIRAHGSKGAFVSKWTINKSDLTVVAGSDLIKRVNVWNVATQSFTLLDSANASALTAFNRFCSADLPAVSAFYNATSGLGTQERIFMNGEEAGNEGRAFGHIVTGANAGTTYELPALGKFSWENSVASPTPSDKTIVAGFDDSTPGQVYIYVGTKTNTGSDVAKAGLTNGKLFGVAVTGLATEVSASFPAANTPFTMVDLGFVKDSTGAALNTRSNNLGVTSFLRPEDGAWDPSNPNDLYFVTTNAFASPSRMWKLHFNNIANPELGGTITAVLDGTEGQKMMDNLTIDKYGHVLIQEDPGSQVHLAKTWQYTIATDKFDLVASHDSTRFLSGGASFLTQDEEASGVIDMEDILGAGNFMVVDQAHYPQPGELVEGGQMLKLFNPATANGAAGALASSSQSPYLTSAAPGVKLNSMLTVGDSINGYKMAGLGDGLGAYDNGNGTFTLLMNHEMGNTVGVIRAHGSKGAFVSKWTINKSDLTVVAGSDLIKRVNVWNVATQSFTLLDSANASALTAFNRFCSADLPAVSAFYNATSGLGTQERIFMNGEEAGNEGRAFGHIVTGANAGTTYELPALGKFSWENSVASPTPSDKTIVAGFDDSTPGQVYIYVGTKTNTGSDVAKAGLTNGKLFGVAVTGLATEVSASFPAANTPFTMVDLGFVKDSTGAALNTRSNNLGVTSFLRPEDGAWDPSNPNDLYFVTTNAFASPSRMWKLHFNNIANPELGGTITAVLDGTEGQKMMDNLTIDKYGHVLIQEDPGSQVHLAKTWQYTIATDKFDLVASHDSTRFLSGGANFLTQDEEASGIIDMEDILGAGSFLVVDQAHYPQPGELVEGGQMLKLFNPATAKGVVLKTISQARALSTDTVRVRGIVTRAWGRFIYIQDSTGAIGVRQTSGALVDSLVSTGVKEGDLVEVVGGRGDFNNYAQIALRTGAYTENSRVTVLARNQQLPAAKLVTLKQLNTNGEQYESQLVKVVGLRTAATGTFAASTNYTVWDGTTVGDTLLYRVISALDTEVDDAPATAIPTDEFSFEGTLIQFCSSPASGCTLGYQLQGVRKYEIKPVVIQTIAQARAMSPNDSVRVRGIVTRAWGRFIYIQDATGAIGVRQSAGAMVDSIVSAGLKEGDSVEVSGGRGDFNNYAQIAIGTGAYTTNSRIKVIARNQPLPAPKVVTLKQLNLNGEQYESQLVKVTGLKTAATGTFTASTNYTVWDGTTVGDTLLYRVISAPDTEVDDAPGVTIPGGKFTFVGTLIQFCSSPASGCTLGYQLQGVRKYEITEEPKLSPYSLIAPVTNTKIITSKGNTDVVRFNWNKSANATQYKWFITTQTGDFATAWLRSNFINGADSIFTYTKEQFDTLAAQHGIAKGDSVQLKWSVLAYYNGDSLMASQSNNLWIVRQGGPIVVPTLNPFSLLTPANNSRIEVEENSTTPIVITWQSSAAGATYKWLVDQSTANFSNPWLVLTSDTTGTATRLTLTSDAIDDLLASKSIAKGDSAKLIWTVRAFKATDSLQATQIFNLTAVRKQTVGLNEINLNTFIQLYPNPTNGNSNLSFTLNTADKLHISVIDLQGKEVLNSIDLNGIAGTNEVELPTAGLKDGIYFVTLSSNGRSAQSKLVVIH